MSFLSGVNKKLITYIIIAVGVVVGLIIVMAILSGIKGSKISPETLEKKLNDAAVAYYKDHVDLLPMNEGETATISDATLISGGYIKNFSKLLKKGYSCTGSVNVQKNGETYLYVTDLDCGESYRTKKLADKIKEDNPIVTQGDGLYQYGENLIFKGEKVNNYISFDGQVWLVVRINPDNTLRVIEQDIVYKDETWDDRYNINRSGNTGINDFEISRVSDGLDKIYYETDTFSVDGKSKIVFKNLCIGKRHESDYDNSGNIECSVMTEKARPIGLLQTNEFMLASLDNNCTYTFDTQCSNYNYLANLQKSTWTLNADADTTHKAYKFFGVNYALATCSSNSGLRLVINLSSNLNYSGGTGTEQDPYIVK